MRQAAEARLERSSTAAQHADLVVRDIDWLITVDGERRVIRGAAIAVVRGNFAAVGKTADIERAWRAERTLDGRGTVATPGLIDNHLHSSFHLARGLADEANAQSFLFEHMGGDQVLRDGHLVKVNEQDTCARWLRQASASAGALTCARS